jgi:hypothetical protein
VNLESRLAMQKHSFYYSLILSVAENYYITFDNVYYHKL